MPHVATSAADLLRELEGALHVQDGRLVIDDTAAARRRIADVAWTAAFSQDDGAVATAQWLAWEVAQALGARSASIQELYLARGRGEVGGFTVPAINLRAQTFDMARIVFEQAAAQDVGAVILELARSEQTYTYQRPIDYATACFAGAVAAGWQGPVFVQGDHYQFNAKKYAADPEAMTEEIRRACRLAIDAGYRNIDIDASTLVDLSKPTEDQQQRENYLRTAEMAALIRSLEEDGVTVSIGGEIGEVGKSNSTEGELRAYLDGLARELGQRAPGAPGISKVSVQTGTSHGGVVLPDGTIAKVKVDFDTIARLSKVAREAYHLSGVVQHGASTLPDDAFDLFTRNGASEVHLATGFQNIIYDSPSFPEDLKNEIYRHLADKHSDEKKPADTEEQFIYKTRKKGFGPFKKKIWALDEDRKKAIAAETEKKLDLYFRTLNAGNTKDLVSRYVGNL